jgi:hypothetical protein
MQRRNNMFLISFYKNIPCKCEEEGCPGTEESHRVLVFDHVELIQALQYLHEYEFRLEAVVEEDICIGLSDFKEFIKEQEKVKEENNGN